MHYIIKIRRCICHQVPGSVNSISPKNENWRKQTNKMLSHFPGLKLQNVYGNHGH